MLSLKPRALHISCHGIENTREKLGENFSYYEAEGDFLLFETDWAEGELVSSQRLRKLVREYKAELDLVVVLACKS